MAEHTHTSQPGDALDTITPCIARFAAIPIPVSLIHARLTTACPLGVAASVRTVSAGVSKACQGRPVGEDDIARLAQQVEESVRATGSSQIEAHEIGLAILEPLRELDHSAYLRFASVYSNFDTLDDFERAIAVLRKQEETPSGE